MLDSPLRIAVLILFYNDEANVSDALGSISRQSYPDYKVICIDNASTDGTIDVIRALYPETDIVTNEINLGYAGAYRQMLRRVFMEDFDAAVLINSDVIVDTDWLSELVRSAYADESIAIAQPKIFLWDNKGNNLANTFGNKIHFLGFGFCGHYRQIDDPSYAEDLDIASASGACMLIKKNAYLDIGELDDKFFAYVEDQDLSWRAKMKGYRIILSAKSIIWHKYVFHETRRNPYKFYLIERNRLYFILKNYSLKTMLLLFPAFLVMECGVILHSVTQGYFRAKMAGYFVFIRNFRPLLAGRRDIQRKRRLSDKMLFNEIDPVIAFDEIESPLLNLANLFLKGYYKCIKKII
jgi:GT2 family glycosyltransferase